MSSSCNCGDNCSCGSGCNCNTSDVEIVTVGTLISGVAPVKMMFERSVEKSEGDGCSCGDDCSCANCSC